MLTRSATAIDPTVLQVAANKSEVAASTMAAKEAARRAASAEAALKDSETKRAAAEAALRSSEQQRTSAMGAAQNAIGREGDLKQQLNRVRQSVGGVSSGGAAAAGAGCGRP